jgi:GntR family transcriptional regulator, transcriptional repressor for pyruvate dehydrogenase complex
MDESNIKKIDRSRVTQIVYDDLKKRILVDGEFTAGDRLPSENELAKLFGVSRNSVRSALQRLSHLGLIDIRNGEGSFVKELSFSNLADLGDALTTDDTITLQLHEFRTDIERSCTKLAVARASEEQLEELKIYADKLINAAQNEDVDEFVKWDYEFHYHLCASTNNKLYEMVYASIKNLFLKCIRENITDFIKENEDGQKTSAKNHMRLVEAIERRDEKKAVGLITLILAPSEIKPLG